MLLELVTHIVIDGLNLGIGIYVFLKNPRGIVHRSFFVFTLGIVGWSASMMLVPLTGQFWPAIAAFWSGEIVVLGFVLLAEVFPESRPLRKRFLFLLLPWFGLVLLTPFGAFIRAARFNAAGYLEPQHGPLFPLFGFVVGAYIAWSIVTMVRKYRCLRGIHRVQMRYFAAGACAFLFLAFLSNTFLPLFGIVEFNLLGPLFSIVFIASTAYAIVRHQFMDIRIVVQRGLLYAFSIGLIACIFFGIDFIVRMFTQTEGWADDVAAAIVGAFGFVWFRRFFERVTDRFFFRNDYDYTAAVRELGRLLHSTIDLAVLLQSLDTFLMRTIKPERSVFSYDAPDKRKVRAFFHGVDESFLEREYEDVCVNIFEKKTDQFLLQEWEGRWESGQGVSETERRTTLACAEKLKIGAAVPFMVRGKTAAVMLLGKKLSGDIFRSKDIELLGVLAHQAGMAIENARLYEEARRYGEEMEMRVAERTEEVRVMQEAQAKFITDASHELQTPVAILKGNMEILEGSRKGNRKTALGVMSKTIERMSRATDNLLTIVRLNSSKEKLHKQEIIVEDLLGEAYDDCIVLAENKGVLLSYASDPARVAGDRDKLKEVILNFVSNALKHTPRGGRIALLGKADGGNVLIVVEDTGSGVAPENLPHIFERFYRIKTDGTSGTGLGLDICRQIIEAHGGTVRAESELSRGSRFVVSLPALRP
ncbi:MAG: ATP-binding protein [Minisyncoccia bacterium]|jgi:signal transduction histidine kinase